MQGAPQGWQRSKDQWGRDYYVNHTDKITQWEAPPNVMFNDEGFEYVPAPSKSGMAPPSYDASVAPVSPPAVYSAHSPATVHPTQQVYQHHPASMSSPNHQVAPHPPSEPYTGQQQQPQYAPCPPAGVPPSTSSTHLPPGHAAQMLPPHGQAAQPHSYPQSHPHSSPHGHAPLSSRPSYPNTAPQHNYAPRPFSHAPVIPTNTPVPANSSSVGGFFKSLANGITRMFDGTRGQPRLYPTVRQTSPVAVHEETSSLETPSDSMRPPEDGRGVCATLCHLRFISCMSFFILAMVGLLIAAIAIKSDENDLWKTLMVIAIVFMVLLLLPYYSIVLSSLCYTDSGRTCCRGTTCCVSRVNPLYLPFHRALAHPNMELRDLTAKVTAMDQATPSLWVRVEGYAHASDFHHAAREHNLVRQDEVKYNKYDNGEPRRSRTRTSPYYGFTHYVPVTVASACNLSCGADGLFEWHSRHGGTALTMAYTYKLTPQDESWLGTVQNQLRQVYMGHESCHYVRTDVVYTLDGVTPPGRQASLSPYDRRAVFSRYLRPGMNAELYNWSMATVDKRPSITDETEINYVRERGQCFCHDLLVNRVCAFFALLVALYAPFICCVRVCTKETTFTHRKSLRLFHELVDVPPQQPYKS